MSRLKLAVASLGAAARRAAPSTSAIFTPAETAAAATLYEATFRPVPADRIAAAEAILAHIPDGSPVTIPTHFLILPTDDARTAAEKYAATLDWNPRK